MPTFHQVFAGVGQAAEDQARVGLADVQNHYQQFLTGQPAPQIGPPGEMESTTWPQEPEPPSYGAALRKYADIEQADIRAKHEAEQANSAQVQGDTSYEPEV